MNKKRQFYERQAKAILQDLRLDKELTHTELALRLQAHGVRIQPQVLINKLNRGTYSFAFALQVLAAMEVKTLRVPRAPETTPKPKPVPLLDQEDE